MLFRSHVFDSSCQKFEFSKGSNDFLNVKYSVPLSYKDLSRTIQSRGRFYNNYLEGYEVKYENFASYHEKWFPRMMIPGVVVSEICFSGAGKCYDYGKIILSKTPLQEWSLDKKKLLERKLKEQMNIDWHEINWVFNNNCQS